jgi:hypothetical protein
MTIETLLFATLQAYAEAGLLLLEELLFATFAADEAKALLGVRNLVGIWETQSP